MDILKKVKDTISKYSMLSEGDRVLIGLSGGPDSVCLAAILDKLKADFNITLHAVYIDHRLRPGETADEKAFCRDLCEGMGIDFLSEAVDVKGHAGEKGMSIQEAARELRYRLLEDIAWKLNAARIALGHHADDRVETFLINLLRGSGRKGLTGIPPVRRLGARVQGQGSGGSISVIRPLIEIERTEIEEFLADDSSLVTRHLSLPFVVDSSNLKKDYFRNWLRLTFLLEMKKRNPSLVQGLCRTMDILREEDEYLETVVTKTLMRLISRKDAVMIELFLSPLETLEKALLRRVLRRAVGATEGLRGMAFIHVESVIDLIKKGRPGDRLYLPKGIRAIRDYSVLRITSATPVMITEYKIQPPSEIVIKESGDVIRASFGERGGHHDGRKSAAFNADILRFPLKIRARADGDFFYPSGFGKKKKLQDFFVDEKVPRDERDRVPVVVSGNDIIWIAGHRADERFTPGPETGLFLIMNYEGQADR
ncbi:MAG: tRNA lysidine(34) synthetase TilS [Nitrospirae bacterium]|nr:tRNA lysidine(34) synthetase TilS [Nitrospirota bacterium]